jgi:hypothetical protein
MLNLTSAYCADADSHGPSQHGDWELGLSKPTTHLFSEQTTVRNPIANYLVTHLPNCISVPG